MTVLERIKTLCREKKNISITTLEQTLGYSNGSLSKAKDIPSSRIMEISDFLEVSVDYLMTGRRHELTIEMADIDSKLIMSDKKVKQYALLLSKMEKLDQELIFSMIDRLSR
jgi:hypothetical protein